MHKNDILSILSFASKAELTNEIARRAGDLRRIYSIPLVDAIIGATALKIDAKLVTRNIRHFERIENLKIVVPY